MSKELEAFNRIIDSIPFFEINEKPNYTLENLSKDTDLIREALEHLESIDNAKPSEAFKGRITYGNNSDLKLYWDKSENYNCNCIVDLKVSNSSYIRNVLKREVVSPVCEDGYYVGGGYALKDLPLIYDRLQQYEDLGDYETIKQALLKAQEQEKALKIIFEKNVRIYWIKSYSCVKHYNNGLLKKEQLTEEEFDTLKRWTNEQNNR